MSNPHIDVLFDLQEWDLLVAEERLCVLCYYMVFLFQARVGPMIAPYIAELKQYDQNAPVAFFGCIALLAR